MDARSILKPTSTGIQCHRYGPVSAHRFHVRVPPLAFGNTEKPNRSSCFAFHDFTSNHSLQSSSGKVHKSLAFNVEKDNWENSSKGLQDEIDIQGEVILQKASLLELTDYPATFADEASDILGKKVSLQLVSSNQIDPESGRGKTCDVAYLGWNPWDGPIVGDKHYKISFKWDSNLGQPGAFFIRNEHPREFFLKSVTLDVPGRGKIPFQCNSWIYPESVDKNERVFFSNKVQATMLIERENLRSFLYNGYQWRRTLDDLQVFTHACNRLNKEIKEKGHARKEELFMLMQIQEHKRIVWMEGPLGWTAWVDTPYDILG